MAPFRKPERLATVDELIVAIMGENAVAKRLAVQDERHAAKHAKINELLDELDFTR